jgi:chromosome segregation ATPase
MLAMLAGSLGLARAEEAANGGDARLEKIEQRVRIAEANLAQLVALDLPLTVKKQKEEITDLNKETTKSKDYIAKIDRRTVYIEERIKKIQELEVDINGLKDAVGILKKDYAQIAARLAALEKAQVKEKP